MLIRLAPVALLVPLLVSCGADAGASDDRPQVVTGFYALEYVAERVAGDRAQVSSLTAPGQEPHDAELTVSQTAEVTEADVVVHLAGFQPVVDEAVEQSEAGHVVDVADAAELVTAEEHGEHHGDHGDHGGHGGHGGHGEEGEDHAQEGGEPDPHFWLDPTRMAAVAEDVTDALIAADPEGERTYRANLRELQGELTTLDREMAAGLSDCERDTVVVSHNAFQYVASRYDLDFHSIAGLSPGAEPSLAHVRELQDLIEDEGLTTVFSETLSSAQMSETLAEDLGLRAAVLDPIEGLSDETAQEDYLSLMRLNLEALQEANGCT